ncbi:MAG: ribose 5-phosphate isomerase B [Deltaproteobacteria bacterium]|nr:ribose 5-phosphate isomerase B [Deltaproteobacteria bacterium]
MIIIGSDHAGFSLKESIKKHLEAIPMKVADVGCFDTNSVHYPEVADLLVKRILSGEYHRGIMICGTGIGMSITANRHKGIRATLCHDYLTAKMSREHNNSNLLVMGGRIIGIETALNVVDVWLSTEFQGGRHQQRLDLIEKFSS